MLRLFLVALCCAAVAGAPNARIIGGNVTTIDNYPHIVALLFSNDLVIYRHNCGGSIINTRSILTAAHCTQFPPSNNRIRVGSTFSNSGGTVYSIITIINHPLYNIGGFLNNDISIMRTSTDIAFSDNVRPAFYPASNYNLPDNAAVIAAGWGVTELGTQSEQLRHVQLYIFNQQTCNQTYGIITENMICAGHPEGGRDQGSSDSGGPLYHNNVVVGVCSFGSTSGNPNFPAVNVKVSQFIDWIQANA